jgi:hypothetical protein
MFPTPRRYRLLVLAALLLALLSALTTLAQSRQRIFLPLLARPGTSSFSPLTPTHRWSDPATWPERRVPTAGEAVTIPAGRVVLLDVSPPPLRSLLLNGSLVFDRRDLELRADWIMVHGPAVLQIGTPERPFTNRATITLTGRPSDESAMGMGTKTLGVMMGGKLEIFGEPRLTWTRLAATAAPGATTITLAEPPGWRVGERIVIASTALDPTQAEERLIAAVNGATLTLDRPLQHRHWGTIQRFDDGRVQSDQRAEVGLLSRNIVIQGDERSAADSFGGHLMVMGADPSRIETNAALRSSARVHGVELRHMGQRNRLGRYPFHWHLNGDSAGDYLRSSAVHSSIQRGIVVHGTSNVLVANNVVYNTPGHAYVVETGAEMNNTFDRNLAILPRPVELTQETLRTQGDDKAAAFWIKGSTNIFTGNVAAGGRFGGFWFDDPVEDPTFRLTFTGNTAHSHGSAGGAGVWLQGRRLDYSRLKFSNLNLYKNEIGFWPDNDNPAYVDSSNFADNKIAATGDAHVSASAIVGRSANDEPIGPVWAERWGGAGLRVYNNSAGVDEVTFVNFVADAAAVSTVACRNESVRIRAEQVRWVNARPDFCRGDTVIDDVDGSFSGSGRPTMIVSDPIMFTSAEGCTTRADGATLCPRLIDYQYLFPKRDLGLAPELTMSRALDGNEQVSTFFPGFAVTIPGHTYRLSRGLDVLPQLHLFLSKARKESRFQSNPASRVHVVVPAPTGNLIVWRSVADSCYSCEWLPQRPEWRVSRLAAAGSLAELREADGERYYYDASAGELHLLLGPTKAVFVERAP